MIDINDYKKLNYTLSYQNKNTFKKQNIKGMVNLEDEKSISNYLKLLMPIVLDNDNDVIVFFEYGLIAKIYLDFEELIVEVSGEYKSEPYKIEFKSESFNYIKKYDVETYSDNSIKDKPLILNALIHITEFIYDELYVRTEKMNNIMPKTWFTASKESENFFYSWANKNLQESEKSIPKIALEIALIENFEYIITKKAKENKANSEKTQNEVIKFLSILFEYKGISYYSIYELWFNMNKKYKALKMINRIYIYQYCCWWSFSFDEWKTIVDDVCKNNKGYELPEKNKIKNTPRCIKKHSTLGNDYYSTDEKKLFFKPLDWTLNEWKNNQSNLNKRNNLK